MAQEQQSYGFGATLDMPLDQAVAAVTAALKEQGFGVLTTIDVRQTLKEKIQVDFEPYVILGACNPQLAHRALQAVHDIGLFLPCNVIVHADGDHTRVDIADPLAMMAIARQPALEAIAEEARERLQQALHALQQTH